MVPFLTSLFFGWTISLSHPSSDRPIYIEGLCDSRKMKIGYSRKQTTFRQEINNYSDSCSSEQCMQAFDKNNILLAVEAADRHSFWQKTSLSAGSK